MKNKKADLSDPAFIGINFDGPPYTCPRCKYSCNKISRFKDHLKKKVQCPILEKPLKPLVIPTCECLKTFSETNVLTNHKKTCHYLERKRILEQNKITINNNINGGINGNNNNKNNTINNNNNSNSNNNNSNNNNNNITNNTTINIVTPNYLVLFPFTQKNKYLYLNNSEQNYLTNVDDDTDPFINYFELTHCSPDNQNFHNLYYPDKSKEAIFVFNGSIWETNTINQITSDIMKFESLDLLNFVNNNCYPNEKIRKKIINRVKYINPSDKKSTVSNNDFFRERKSLQGKLKKLLVRHSTILNKTFTLTRNINKVLPLYNTNKIVDTHTISSSSESTTVSESVESNPIKKFKINEYASKLTDSCGFDSTESEPIKKSKINKNVSESTDSCRFDSTESEPMQKSKIKNTSKSKLTKK